MAPAAFTGSGSKPQVSTPLAAQPGESYLPRNSAGMRVGKYASGYFSRLGSGPICSVQSIAPQYEVTRSTRRSRIAPYTSRQAGVTSLISAIAYDESTASKRCQLSIGGSVFASHISEGWPFFDQSSFTDAFLYMYLSQPQAFSESSG